MREILVILFVLSLFAVSCGEDETTEETADNETADTSEVNDETVDQTADDTMVEETVDEDTVQEEEVCEDYSSNEPLMKGDCVPDFTLPAHDGTNITLSDYRGKWVVFSSFPMVNTSVCTGQMQKLDEMFDDFISNNIQPFGFNNEPPDQKDDWCESMNVTKLLILSDHDPKDAISKKFGINGTYTKRADTIIDPQGRFVEVIPSSGASSVAPLLEHIKGLQNEE
jgi:peroxiredoxin Q/BCP